MEKIFSVIVVLSLSGCGTFSTTFSNDFTTNNKLKKAKTYCDEIPRVYAGVLYDACLFNAEPSTRNPDVISASKRDSVIPLVAVDLVLSCVADTLVLPYSIYEQATKGNLKVKR